MIIIGIDPGTNCGWSVIKDNKPIASGTWDLKPNRHEGGGMRYLRCRRYFEELITGLNLGITAVAYEEVRRHMGVDAAHIYGGIVGQITAICEEKRIPFRAITVTSIKKFATGHGHASKESMIQSLADRFNYNVNDDNEADACWVGIALYDELNLTKQDSPIAVKQSKRKKNKHESL